MRYFRRLPPLLRVASLLAVLFPLASLVLLVALMLVSLRTFPHTSVTFFLRMLVLGLNLSLLSGACSFAVRTYTMRFRRPDSGLSLFDSWQRQVGAIAGLAVLPLCAITLALVSPSTPPVDFELVFLAFAVSVLAALVVLVAHLWVLVMQMTRGTQRVAR
jgi:hypothetical protein